MMRRVRREMKCVGLGGEGGFYLSQPILRRRQGRRVANRGVIEKCCWVVVREIELTTDE